MNFLLGLFFGLGPSLIIIATFRMRTQSGHPVPKKITVVLFSLLASAVSLLIQILLPLSETAYYPGITGLFLALHFARAEYRVYPNTRLAVTYRQFKFRLKDEKDFIQFKKDHANDPMSDYVIQEEINRRWNELPFPQKELVPNTTTGVSQASAEPSREKPQENKSPLTNDVSDSSNDTLFCRKCGTKLLNDSTFCHKCGTEVITNNN